MPKLVNQFRLNKMNVEKSPGTRAKRENIEHFRNVGRKDPEEAIIADTEPGAEKWVELNRKYSEVWPNITERRDPPLDAGQWAGKPNKLDYISPEPASA